MFKYFLFISVIFMCGATPSWACKCRYPTPERDHELIQEVDIIATVYVTKGAVTKFQPRSTQGVVVVNPLHVYKGAFLQDKNVEIHVQLAGSCTRLLPVDTYQDVLLFEEGGVLSMRSMCTQISSDAWKMLKGKRDE